MSNNKQTFNHNPNQSSVDWVIGEILKHQMTYYGTSSMPLRIIEQAKEMHKKEIEDAYYNGGSYEDLTKKEILEIAEQFYNETYGDK